MKLLIFPGGGNPDTTLYAKVYGLLTDHAHDYGYSGVDVSVRWPGHTREADSGEALTLRGAYESAQRVLHTYEEEGKPYDILARSFGTYVALKVAARTDVSHLRRVLLWGSPPYWQVWELFTRDLNDTQAIARSKGLLVDDSFFPSLEPIESLLKAAHHTVVVATGADDKYSTPEFHTYLMSCAKGQHNVWFRPVIAGAPHEVTADLPTDVVSNYLTTLLG